MFTLEDKDIAQLPIVSDAEILSGTRVPVDALLDNLAAGLTVDEFLENFPTVTREQVLQILESSKLIIIQTGDFIALSLPKS